MISRHGFSHALRPISPIVQFCLKSRFEDRSLHLYSTFKDGGQSLTSPTNQSALPTKIRTLMRSTPHPLTTIVSQSYGTPDDRPCGLLVSSFNTITLDPIPYVSFNIKRPSSTYDAICSSGLFTASGIGSAIVAHAFVRGNGSTKGWERMVGKDGKLKDDIGGTWWMSCRLVDEKSLEVADHVVVVGEVLGAGAYGGGKAEMGLAYAEGKYRKIGEAVDVKGK